MPCAVVGEREPPQVVGEAASGQVAAKDEHAALAWHRAVLIARSRLAALAVVRSLAVRSLAVRSLVRASRVVDSCLLHRITRIAQIDEVYSLDNAPVFNIEAGYDACLKHYFTLPSVQSAPNLNRAAHHKERGR